MATRHERFEWDDGKAASNLAKHGVSFRSASMALKHDQRAVETLDDRRRYGEMRVNSIAWHDGVLLTVCWTRRGEVTRIISARIAGRRERKRYDA